MQTPKPFAKRLPGGRKMSPLEPSTERVHGKMPKYKHPKQKQNALIRGRATQRIQFNNRKRRRGCLSMRALEHKRNASVWFKARVRSSHAR